MSGSDRCSAAAEMSRLAGADFRRAILLMIQLIPASVLPMKADVMSTMLATVIAIGCGPRASRLVTSWDTATAESAVNTDSAAAMA